MPLDIAWRRPLLHSLCVAVTLPPQLEELPVEAIARLHPEEADFARDLPPRRRATWVGGRLALRAALEQLDVNCGPVLATPRGRPALPPNIAASISHKAGLLAVALVLVEPTGLTVGVDLEPLLPRREGIAALALTAPEQAYVEALPFTERWPEVLLRFSLKEAVYKALDPWLNRAVEFDEVEIVRAGQALTVRLELHQGEGPFAVDVSCSRPEPGLLLTTARVRSC